MFSIVTESQLALERNYDRVSCLKHVGTEGMERVTQAADLDWTIVRPTRLTNGKMTGVYRADEGHLPRAAKAISRSDVAHFLLGVAERGEHVRRVVGLAC